MDDRVILDDRSFKALSADSRVNILKSLGERRRTLSELSTKLNLGNSTIKEHCDILIDAQLIKQIDEGRKWKYYELTSKGKQIVSPNLFDEVKVLIVLCIGAVIFGGFIIMLLQGSILGASSSQSISKSYQNDVFNSQVVYTDNTQDLTNTNKITSETNIATGKAKDTNDLNEPIGPTGAVTKSLPTREGDAYAQCTIQQTPSTSVEFYIASIVLALIFGLFAGWIFTRRT